MDSNQIKTDECSVFNQADYLITLSDSNSFPIKSYSSNSNYNINKYNNSSVHIDKPQEIKENRFSIKDYLD